MAEQIMEGVSPTRMDLLDIRKKLVLAEKGHKLLEEKRDALVEKFFGIIHTRNELAKKIDNNSYMTSMKGVKFKIGHKRPHWKSFSYDYPEQISYKERVINILEQILKKLKEED